ncbi:MAG: hypothetical protein M1820_001653 [Bogoriella megaspora]|nr:MAG: hypothetical protein M1820_001653 [Bogoriella megaspora]
MASVARTPFGELGTPRLQQLQNVKNRQNAITTSNSAPAKSSTFTFSSPLKRQHSPTFPSKSEVPVFDDNDDSENIDPSIFLSPSKRAKNENGFPIKKPNISLNLTPTPTLSSPAVTRPTLTPKLTPLRGSSPPPTSRMTAPAGRSPQRKRIGLLGKSRRVSAPIKRIDPPLFGSPSKSSSALPFSIDAALSGSLNSYKPSAPQAHASPSEALNSHPVVPEKKAMPKSWFFAIHEDTPEEEATNLMEHSACTLDISDDEEEGCKSDEETKGKENVPPPDWVAQQPRLSSSSLEDEAPTKKGRSAVEHAVVAALKNVSAAQGEVMAVDVAPRSPLEELKVEEYFAEGSTKDSVDAEDEGAHDKGNDVAAADNQGKDDFVVYESDHANDA